MGDALEGGPQQGAAVVLEPEPDPGRLRVGVEGAGVRSPVSEGTKSGSPPGPGGLPKASASAVARSAPRRLADPVQREAGVLHRGHRVPAPGRGRAEAVGDRLGGRARVGHDASRAARPSPG